MLHASRICFRRSRLKASSAGMPSPRIADGVLFDARNSLGTVDQIEQR